MAKCAICEKAAHFGNAVSHSHRRSNKKWNANVKSVKVKVNGASQKMYVCTSCLRSGKVERCIRTAVNFRKFISVGRWIVFLDDSPSLF